jgi:hypothetical protein
MQVKEFTTQKIDLEKIKFDKTNPNVVSEQQMKGLQRAVKKFGFLVPVVLNQKYQILDGEHRVRIYQKLGMKQIPAYIINVDKLDGKILRQVMNKLKGQHDPIKDSTEFQVLFKNDKLEDLAKLLAMQPKRFIESLDIAQQATIPEDEWQDMPEFMQPELKVFRHFIVNCNSQKDVDDFAKMIGQKITDRTKSISIPYRPQEKTTTVYKSDNTRKTKATV